MQLCGQRYYDSGTGRWLTRDPIGTAGGLNVYGYCGNNPVNGIDPSGLAKAPASMGSGKISIVFNAFIPTAVANAPLFNNPLFGTAYGDARGYSSTGGTYRVMHTVVINLKTGNSAGWFDMGVSHDSKGRVVQQWDWSSLHTTVCGNKKKGWNVHMSGNPRYPLAPIQKLAPGISYQFDIHVAPNGAIDYFESAHDSYPAYEMWLYAGKGASQIYGYMPPTGQTAYGLMVPAL